MSGKELMIGDKPLSSLRVVDLKEELEKRGLSKSGSKKDLAERLRVNVQLEIAQQQGAAADEEELPNISMQEKLAEQNPFIRDYFASQAELFHSQKLAKQLIEEERRRESEASAPSADEGGENSATEDKAFDSSTAGGKVKKLARRFENQATEKENSEPSKKIEQSPSPQKVVAEISIESVPAPADKASVPVAKAPQSEEKSLDLKMSIDDLGKKSSQDEPKSNTSSPSSSRSESRSRSNSPAPKLKAEQLKEVKEHSDSKLADSEIENKVSEHEASGASEEDVEAKLQKVKEEVDVIRKNGVGNVKKLAEQFETQTKEAPDTVVDKSDEPVDLVSNREKDSKNEEDSESVSSRSSSKSSSKSRSPSPVLSSKQANSKPESPVKTIKSPVKGPSSKPEPQASPVKEVNSKSERQPSPVKEVNSKPERQPSPVKEVSSKPDRHPSPVKEVSSKHEAQPSPVKEVSSKPDRHPSPVKEVSSKTERQPTPVKTTRSSVKEAEESKVRRLTEQLEKKSKDDLKLETREEISLVEPVAVKDKIPVEAPKRKLILAPDNSDSKPRAEVRKLRKISSRNEEIQDEDALDYGEEEKVKSEPAKFDWTRRILRLKNKHVEKDPAKKWQRDVDSKVAENINTEFLNQWFPEVKLVSASDLRLEDKEKSPSADDKVKVIRTVSIESEDGRISKMENITITRKVSLIPMVPSQMEEDVDKDLSPPRHPPTELILITNLVRPFTLPQLKELLQRTGNLEELWVDKIKSKCIAKYAKEEEAFETRAALHGVNWPQSNPKALHVDYTTQDRMDDYKSRESGDPKPPVVEKPMTAEALPVREWDLGKRGKSRSPNRSRRRSGSRDRKRLRRSPSPHKRRGSRSPHPERRSRGDVKEPEPLGKALDELFRKTTVTPSIYWLPLTPQQIGEKEELRRKRMVERERRLAEMSKIRPR